MRPRDLVLLTGIALALLMGLAPCHADGPLAAGEGRVLDLSAYPGVAELGVIDVSDFDDSGDVVAIRTSTAFLLFSSAEWRILSAIEGGMERAISLSGSPCRGLGVASSFKIVSFDCRTGKIIQTGADLKGPVFHWLYGGRRCPNIFAVSQSQGDLLLAALDPIRLAWQPASSHSLPIRLDAVDASDGDGRCRVVFAREGASATKGSRPGPTVVFEVDTRTGRQREVAQLRSAEASGALRFLPDPWERLKVSPSGKSAVISAFMDESNSDLMDRFEVLDLTRGVVVRTFRNPTADPSNWGDVAWVGDTHIVFVQGSDVILANVASGATRSLPLPKVSPIVFAGELAYAPASRMLAITGDAGVWFYRIPEALP